MRVLFKILVVIEILGLSLSKVQSQNLVPNGSFEDTVNCPTLPEQLYNAVGWINPTGGTPEYYNACAAPSSGVDVPGSNSFGYQFAYSGNGYVGIYGASMDSPPSGPLNCREYVQIQLTQALIAGHTYHVSFHLSLADYSTIAITELGAYFSNTAITLPSNYNFPYSPQVVSDSTYFLQDTTNWDVITGDFIANGGEQFITLGNFNDASHVDTINKPVTMIGGTFAYYFLDDVSVSDVTSISESQNEYFFVVYPNPSTNKITLETTQPKSLVFMYGVTGNLLKQIELNTTRTEVDFSSLGNGIYYLKNGVVTNKIIIQH